jgi:hypothetical protein
MDQRSPVDPKLQALFNEIHFPTVALNQSVGTNINDLPLGRYVPVLRAVGARACVMYGLHIGMSFAAGCLLPRRVVAITYRPQTYRYVHCDTTPCHKCHASCVVALQRHPIPLRAELLGVAHKFV